MSLFETEIFEDKEEHCTALLDPATICLCSSCDAYWSKRQERLQHSYDLWLAARGGVPPIYPISPQEEEKIQLELDLS